MQTRFDALIIGAGPAGSTAAIRLAQAGWSVAVIEKQEFPRRKVCGECVAASNLPLLDALGVGAAFHALAGPALKRVALMHGAEAVCAALPAYAGGPHAWGKALGREHLDALLLERAAEVGATVLQPWTVREVQGFDGAYQCIVVERGSRNKVRLHAPVLIAAHGSWEPGAANATHRQAPCPGDLFAFKANFANSALEQNMLPVLSFRGGYGGMVLGEHGLLTLACCVRRDRLAAVRQCMPQKSAGESMQAYLLQECAGVRAALEGANRQGKWLSTPIFPGMHMPRDGGKSFMVGNAAGEAHPIIGEGMSMAMQGAWLLCEHLLCEPSVLRDAHMQRLVRRGYAQAWRANFLPRMRLAAGFAHAAMHPRAARALLPVLRSWPCILSHAARWSGKVSDPGFFAHAPGGRMPHARLEPREVRPSHEFNNGEKA